MRDYRDLISEAEHSVEYWAESTIIEFTEDLERAMKERGISRAELARRLGTSQAYVTKILRGNANFTLCSMVKLARAVEMDLRLHLAPVYSITHWHDEITATPSEAAPHLLIAAEPEAEYGAGESGPWSSKNERDR